MTFGILLITEDSCIDYLLLLSDNHSDNMTFVLDLDKTWEK